MRILVTGSEGTLGVPLVDWLRKEGHTVHGCDLRHAEDSGESYTRADIADYGQLAGVVNDFGPTVVYNLAAEFGRHNGEHYPAELWRSNVVGLKNLLRLERSHRFKLIHASSSEVYGEGPFDAELMDEAMTDRIPLRHHNDYAMSKWVNEQQIRNHIRAHDGTKIVVPRFFNAYGPGEHYHSYRSVVCLFCYRALHGLPYTVYRDYHRVFQYIDDFIPTVGRIAEADLPTGATINIGGTEYVSVEHLDDMIRVALGRDFRSQVTYMDQDAHNTVSKRPDITRARDWLGHDPKVPLDRGVNQTLAWMRRKYADNPAFFE